MTAVRVIKKYPNRRLYDTELSRYVTLVDVRDLLMCCCSLYFTGFSQNKMQLVC